MLPFHFRVETKETKIPYVRLERLKICPPPSGELPVFKVQPQNKDEDGSLRLLVKYGARYKSMSIKVCLSRTVNTALEVTRV